MQNKLIKIVLACGLIGGAYTFLHTYIEQEHKKTFSAPNYQSNTIKTNYTTNMPFRSSDSEAIRRAYRYAEELNKKQVQKPSSQRAP